MTIKHHIIFETERLIVRQYAFEIDTENFFLLDSNRIVRGFYNGFDTARQETLVRDIPILMLEKDKSSPSVFREFIPILPIIFIAIGIVFIIILLLNRAKNKQR